MKYFKIWRQDRGEIYPPLTTNDFGPYLTKIADKAKEIDAVWAFFSGTGRSASSPSTRSTASDTLPFYVIATRSTTRCSLDEGCGDRNQELPPLCGHHQEPGEREVRQGLRGQVQGQTRHLLGAGLRGAKTIAMAIDAVKGDVENKEAFLAALRKVKFNAPRDPSPSTKPERDPAVYIRRVDKVGAPSADGHRQRPKRGSELDAREDEEIRVGARERLK